VARPGVEAEVEEEEEEQEENVLEEMKPIEQMMFTKH
jgi:hypothetical protein